MAGGVRVVLHHRLIEDLLDGDDIEDLLQDLVDEAAETAAGLAPRDTGAGADSIHGEVWEDGGHLVGGFGWDPEHAYMRFQEEGTEYVSPQPFVRPAGDSLSL